MNESPSIVKQALQALRETRTELETLKRDRSEPIAIVGVGCRFPGGAESPEAYWDFLERGGDGIIEIPRDRWDADALFDPDPDAIGKTTTKWGGFLPTIDRFDPTFFGISGREASWMDPMHRLLLETAWEALEHAGVVPEQLAGSATGVFVGAFPSDYARLAMSDPRRYDLYTMTGSSNNVAAGRLAYTLDLRGPCVMIDTACSSSLVAIHLACQSLRAQECRVALAGGVNVVVSPEPMIILCKMRMLAPDGRCKTFDAKADGFVRGDGCGLVVLKRYSDALADGDDILALIRGSAVNQDGRTNGLTAPNMRSQVDVIRQAHKNAGIDPGQISYVEAHGTGTSLGDPIEIEALKEAFGQGVQGPTPCAIGSVKSNFGHLEAAAGVASLIKVALMFEHGAIPGNLHFESLNPNISLDHTRFFVPSRLSEWSAPGSKVAALSSFGWSGTNAHFVLEQPPARPQEPTELEGPQILALSAKTPEALRELAQAYRGWLTGREVAAHDLCYTAAVRRTHHDFRLALVGNTVDDFAKQLASLLAKDPVAAREPQERLAEAIATLGPATCKAYLEPDRDFALADSVKALSGAQADQQPPRSGPSQDRVAFLGAIACLYELGCPVAWRNLYPSGSHLRLPSYPWQRQVYWLPGQDRTVRGAVHGRPQLLCLSADSPRALANLATTYVDFLKATQEDLTDICYSANQKVRGASRLAVVGASPKTLCDQLDAQITGLDTSGMEPKRLPQSGKGVVFVFCGQGPQYPAMGRQLMATEPVFRQSFEQIDRLVAALSGWSLLAELSPDREGDSRIHQTEVTQPALFAIQVALADLWRSWGITPAAVIGHSVGEIAAAFVAGALTLEEATCIVVNRGRLMQRTAGRGKTAAAEISFEEAIAAIAGREASLSVAAHNSPTSVTLSGDPEALGEVLSLFAERGVFARLLKVDHAFHSPQMDELLPEFATTLASLSPRATRIPFLSTVTGKAHAGQDLTADYWCRNLRDSVLFASAVTEAIGQGHDRFLEISPHPVLSSSIVQCNRRDDAPCTVWASLRRDTPDLDTMLTTLGNLVTEGASANLEALNPGGKSIDLPSAAARPHSRGDGHPLLGEALVSSLDDGAHYWDFDLEPTRFPYLEDHWVLGTLVVPGALFVSLALSAAIEAFGPGPHLLESISFKKPLFLRDEEIKRIQIVVVPTGPGTATFRFSSLARGPQKASWVLHASGALKVESFAPSSAQPASVLPGDIVATCVPLCSGPDFYADLEALGYGYGPAHQGIDELWSGPDGVLARMTLTEIVRDETRLYPVHPALLDAIFQGVLGLWGQERPSQTYLPAGIERLRVYRQPTGELWTSIRSRPGDDCHSSSCRADLTVMDASGAICLEVQGLELKRMDAASRFLTEDLYRRWLHEVRWQPKPLGAIADPGSTTSWLVFMDQRGIGDQLIAPLTAMGDRCIRVERSESTATPSQDLERLGDDCWRIDPTRPDSFKKLFEALHGVLTPQRGILFLWPLDDGPLPDDAVDQWPSATVESQCLGVLYLAQALDTLDATAPPRLYVVTSGAQAISSEIAPVNPVQSPVWALSRVLGSENPQTRATCIDLPVTLFPQLIGDLIHEIRSRDREDQVVLRETGRFAARLIPIDTGDAPAPVSSLRDDATYLVTGGLGGIGLKLATWLADCGARHLVLVGRRQPSADALSVLANLGDRGMDVKVVQADIAQPDGIARITAELDSLPPLAGIFHLAATLQDGVLTNQDANGFRTVLAPKVAGSWNLHRLAAGRPLEHFVMFSSAASVLGSAGQSNYAAANAFEDALAHYRRALGLPAIAVNWGPWSEVGMAAAQSDRGDRLAQLGLNSLAPDQGFAILALLLGGSHTQVAVLPLDRQRWIQANPRWAQSPLFEELTQGHSVLAKASIDLAIRDRLQATSPDEYGTLLELYLRQLVADLIKIDADRITREAELTEIGMDSLVGIELRNRLEADLKMPLPGTLIWTHRTIAALTGHLEANLRFRALAEA